MGVYRKKGRLYIRYKDAKGRWRSDATGLPLGEEQAAERMLRQVEDAIASQTELGLDEATIAGWAPKWIERRKARGLSMAKADEQRLRLYILPELGAMRLDELKTRHVRRFVELMSTRPSAMGGKLAPRSVRHIYGTLRQLMADATREDLIERNPCDLGRGDLPSVADKDPEWRGGAVFTRAELELLISSPEVPMDRRVIYALAGAAGLRWGEVAALRWRSYDPSSEPLGRLTISAAHSRHRGTVGKTKTGAVRHVPVHPTLAAVLAGWKLHGWQEMVGRQPEADDWIVPSRELGEEDEVRLRSGVRALRRLHDDLARLGLRQRRLHDLRRTMISLAQDDGASPEVLRWITHTPASADIVASYTTLRWRTLCEAIAKVSLQISDAARYPVVTPLRAKEKTP
ncbi:tyrosine-type recombinase/integrase [Vulgatibacter sp.]|uniref:tyrosine-type recombinase/integrase n=1 Tax=Vulgatibacter sp. TaxID=1971226 RepID=UPI00356143E1